MPPMTSAPPTARPADTRSPSSVTAPATLTSGSRYSSRPARGPGRRATARFQASMPTTLLPMARNASSPQAAAGSRPSWSGVTVAAKAA